MVPVQELINIFSTMYKEHWDYVAGAAQKGEVDCSGAFTYAFKQFKINCPHGSNAIARRYIVGGLKPISEAQPGMAAFKVRAPGEKGYNLPEKYRMGGSDYTGDLNDYYHIGLVDDDPRYVLNAKGTNYGFCRDRISDGWDYVGYLTGVEYKKGEEDMEYMKVVLPAGAAGSTVNLRKDSNKNSAILYKVPVGSIVGLFSDSGKWCNVVYDGYDGYMMSNYLEYVGQDDVCSDDTKRIEDALKAIQEQVELIGSIIGRG